MIGSIRGRVLSVEGVTALIELSSGLGYEVEVPGNLLTKVRAGEECFLYIHHSIREDAEQLYGFDSKESRMLFREVIKINGVGPKVAMALLSTFDLPSFIEAVRTDHIAALTATPGVGKKTAERIIVELKDRLSKLHLMERVEFKQSQLASLLPDAKGIDEDPNSPAVVCSDAIGGLVGLGFKEAEAMRTVKQVYQPGFKSEDVVVAALKLLKPNLR